MLRLIYKITIFWVFLAFSEYMTFEIALLIRGVWNDSGLDIDRLNILYSTKSSSIDVRSCFSPLCFLDWMASCQLTTMLTTVYSAPQSSPVILTLLLHRTSWVRGCCRANTLDVFVMKSIQKLLDNFAFVISEIRLICSKIIQHNV